jgi:chromosomal replication initiator protein
MLDKDRLWESVLTELQLSLSGANFQTWFKGKTNMLSIDKNTVEIGCVSSYNKTWIEERYITKIKEIVDRLTGKPNTLLFKVSASNLSVPVKKRRGRENPTVPLFAEESSPSLTEDLEIARINQRYSFSNFIVGQSNQLAYAVAKAVVEEPFDRYNPLLIYGGVGVGKTHLLQAVAQEVILRRTKAKVLYCSSETFTNDMVEAIQKRSTPNFRDKYRNVEFLLVDDIQFIAGRESTQEEFFHTFNSLYGQGKQVVLSCDKKPEELDSLQERLKNRFIGGMVAKIDPPDLELREAILLARAKSAGIKISFQVIRALAERLGPSIRELEGGLLRLAAVSDLTSRDINLSLVNKAVVSEKKVQDPLGIVTQSVASFFSVSTADVKSSKRNKEYVFPRQVAMYLLRKSAGLSFNDIARYFGGKDHTAVIYSVNKVAGLVKNSAETHNMVRGLETKIFKS